MAARAYDGNAESPREAQNISGLTHVLPARLPRQALASACPRRSRATFPGGGKHAPGRAGTRRAAKGRPTPAPRRGNSYPEDLKNLSHHCPGKGSWLQAPLRGGLSLSQTEQPFLTPALHDSSCADGTFRGPLGVLSLPHPAGSSRDRVDQGSTGNPGVSVCDLLASFQIELHILGPRRL